MKNGIYDWVSYDYDGYSCRRIAVIDNLIFTPSTGMVFNFTYTLDDYFFPIAFDMSWI